MMSLNNYIIYFAKSGIHIKPENKGKFTETKKRTGKTTEELTHSKNPLTRKRAIFALNAKKWKHADGGTLLAKGDIILPEVVIKPSKESILALKAAKEMFPNKNLRYAILEDYDNWAIDELGISLTDAVNRLYHLYKLSGSPKVSSKSSLVMGLREHYNPINNTIYVPDPTFDGYVAEVAHAYLKASGRWNYLDLAKDILSHPGEWLGNASEEKDERAYKRNGSYEYDAHEEVEPSFWDYIEGSSLNIPKKAKIHFLGGKFLGIATDNGIMVSKDKNVSKSKKKVKLVKKNK